jgi:hypothetical protein
LKLVVQRIGDGVDAHGGGGKEAALGACVRTPTIKEENLELSTTTVPSKSEM